MIEEEQCKSITSEAAWDHSFLEREASFSHELPSMEVFFLNCLVFNLFFFSLPESLLQLSILDCVQFILL